MHDRSVTFGGVKGNVIGKGNIDLPNTLKLNNVRLVEGLSANLISISQLCDEGYSIKYSKKKCEVLNSEQTTVMLGSRLLDNYYHWDHASQEMKCNLS